jgi:hypothetical protein
MKNSIVVAVSLALNMSFLCSCSSTRIIVNAGRVVQKMWQEDTCGVKGNRSHLALSLYESDFFNDNFKSKKDVVDFFGQPDLVVKNDSQCKYLYFISSETGCRTYTYKPQEIQGTLFGVYFTKDMKQIITQGIFFYED